MGNKTIRAKPTTNKQNRTREEDRLEATNQHEGSTNKSKKQQRQ
jgi:hypothetical protein